MMPAEKTRGHQTDAEGTVESLHQERLVTELKLYKVVTEWNQIHERNSAKIIHNSHICIFSLHTKDWLEML